jgi:hypothetical protein
MYRARHLSLVWESKEDGERVLRPPEEMVKPPSNLVLYDALENKVLLCPGLLKMADLVDFVAPCDMMICLDPKLMRTHPKLPNQNPKSMNPMSKCIRGSNNKAIPQLHDVFCIKGHLGVYSLGGSTQLT